MWLLTAWPTESARLANHGTQITRTSETIALALNDMLKVCGPLNGQIYSLLKLTKTKEKHHQRVMLTRLRIGHTLLTHRRLMERSAPPFCEDCIVPLIVKHVIAECPTFLDIRL